MVLLTVLTMLCVTSPELTYLTTGSLYILTTFTQFPNSHMPHPLPLAATHCSPYLSLVFSMPILYISRHSLEHQACLWSWHCSLCTLVPLSGAGEFDTWLCTKWAQTTALLMNPSSVSSLALWLLAQENWDCQRKQHTNLVPLESLALQRVVFVSKSEFNGHISDAETTRKSDG